MSQSIIQTAGEILVIVALLYLLLLIGAKVTEIELFPEWYYKPSAYTEK